jgi:nitrogen fixation/metabolism regulation signal transduction histidine kinase
VKWIVAIGVAAGVGLVYLLSQASANTALFTRHYPWLIALCAIVAVALMALIGYQLAGLVRKLRASVFGALLTARLTAVFVLMALLPGTLLYALSVQFLDRSIESWFESNVDRALESGLNLGRGVLLQSWRELSARLESVAPAAAQAQDAATLASHRERMQLDHLQVRAADARLLWRVQAEDAPPPNDAAMLVLLGQARDVTHPAQATEQLPDGVLLLRAALRVGEGPSARYVLTEQRFRGGASDDARRVEAGYRDYQELSIYRSGLKRLFAVTLTLAMLLTLFSAIALALLLSQRISAPLSALAEATRAVAAGDYSRLNPVTSHDEFGVLTQSFNTMTRRIGDATTALEQQRRELTRANQYLEGILSNLSSGVLTFTPDWLLRTGNAAAWQALGCDPAQLAGVPLPAWPGRAPHLAPLVSAVQATLGPRNQGTWSHQLSLTGEGRSHTLLLRGTPLKPTGDGDEARGFVLVFDDITQLKDAERAAAWGEVARRLAHEIKNPLTPIQLSAERLRSKLESRLTEGDAEMLRRATSTIVSQVTALKGMVDDFGQYARASSIRLSPTDFNQLVRDVLHLYEATPVALELDLDPAVGEVAVDAALMRQVLHNLVQNSQDALSGQADARIRVRSVRRGPTIILAVEDNGSGIPASVLPRIFEPYVTTKVRGTGLGLAIVKRIVEEHGGDARIDNVLPRGARATLRLPAEPVPAEPTAAAHANGQPESVA